jgi:hypothetical protein
MTIEALISVATRVRRDIAEAGRKNASLEITVPKKVAALIVGVSADSFNLPIMAIPKGEEMTITISSNARDATICAFTAWSNEKDPELRNDFRQRQYRALYSFLQRGFHGQAKSLLNGGAGLFLAVLGQSDEPFQQVLDHASQTGTIEEVDLKMVANRLTDIYNQLPEEYRSAQSGFVPENALNSIAGS